MSGQKIVIFVEGGIVTGVYSSEGNASVRVVDWDGVEDEEENPDTKKIHREAIKGLRQCHWSAP